MTAGNQKSSTNAQGSGKQTSQSSSQSAHREGNLEGGLKDALAGALKDHHPKERPAPELGDTLQRVTGQPASGARNDQPSQSQSKKPFEVPEDTLRAIFKEQ